MITPAGGLPPFALDGTVTRDKLLELLAVEAELSELDFKQQCDLSNTRELVELTKDIGAMSIRAGYLAVGVDDWGKVVGLQPSMRNLFDQAILTDKIAKYLPSGFQVRSAVHDVDAGAGLLAVALIWVGPHPDGLCVFTRNGDYTDEHGKQTMAFRKGDVYARHGTRSEPWNQADIEDVLAALVARAKDSWRAEHVEEAGRLMQTAFAGLSVSAGPSGAFTWQLDHAGFEAAAVELLRKDDDIPVRRMLRSASTEIRMLVQSPSRVGAADLTVVLDRIAGLAALALDLRRPGFSKLAIQSLLDIYGWAAGDASGYTSSHTPASVLELHVAERLYAVGALAVRQRDWEAVRGLALAPIPALAGERRWTWHRNALIKAWRGGLMVERDADGKERQLSLLLFARAAAVADALLRPDFPGDVSPAYATQDPLLDSLCQFDFLVSVVTAAESQLTSETDLLGATYPNYARFDGGRTNPIVPLVVLDAQVRERLLHNTTDKQLALLLELASRVAENESQSFFGWEGYTDASVQDFIAEWSQRVQAQAIIQIGQV